LTTPDIAAMLDEAELLEFLFLPGFTLKDRVTDVSGRGVGLDVVRELVRRVRGAVCIVSRPGEGTEFQLALPVTLSVARALLVDIGGELYAFPVAHITRAVMVPRDTIQVLEGRQHVAVEGKAVGLVTAHQVLTGTHAPAADGALAVIVMGDTHHTYGLVVDRLVAERELVVQPLDPELGKINGVAATAVMDDGSPVLIVDTEDLLRAMNKVVVGGRVAAVPSAAAEGDARRRKRVLVVDDSLTVRELERKVLGNRGYEVEVAIDGMDGWNAVRTGQFDLVVTDVDMPRMDGIELTTLISGHHSLQSLPVVVVSYKDREEDRQRGLEAGAARYLTKGSFHEDALLQAVVDLIGEAEA
jgi:two-component system sensor histidine kinase and response regulator WspE